MSLPSVEQARAAMLARIAPLPAESIRLGEALGRVLSAELRAGRDQPPFAASAMDGWAVRSADGAGRRRIVGESAAGRGMNRPLGAGEAARIFTGGALPEGADAVVMQEDARRAEGAVVVPDVEPGRHVRPRGQDFQAGAALLAAGVRLDPWRLALAAAAGAASLPVARRPRVTVLATGDELVQPGESPGPFQIFDSGGTALASLARMWGADSRALVGVGDDEAAICRTAREADADLLVVIGGASVGEHDVVKPALDSLGLQLDVDSVAVRPGKPVWFGLLGDGRPVLGLPGNPASALVCAELFLGPLLRALQGADPALPMILARCAESLAANGPREHWMRGRLRRHEHRAPWVAPFADQDSSLVSVFAACDVLIRRHAAGPATSPGAIVEVLPLSRG